MAQWDVVTPLNVTLLLRQYSCSQGDGSAFDGFQGIDAMSGTAVQAFHQQLLGTGLPFRVNVKGTALVDSGREDLAGKFGFRIPPVSVNPHLAHGTNTWADSLHLIRTQITLLAGAARTA